MYERVLIAALDVRDDDAVNVSRPCTPYSTFPSHPSTKSRAHRTAASLSLTVLQWCLEALLLKFGSSGLRMSRLLGLHCEYHQRWEEAVEHYEAILAADPTNITAYKRLIAVAKSRGKVDDAISRLVRYTKTFAADETGWVELCDLYVQQQQMELAGFAMEECILIAPENHQYHTRYAEVSTEAASQTAAVASHSGLTVLLCLTGLPADVSAVSCCTRVGGTSSLGSTSLNQWS